MSRDLGIAIESAVRRHPDLDGLLSPKDAQEHRTMRLALRAIARKGCERLVDPSTCRAPNGYPREEWCDGCTAAEGLGLPQDWFVMKR